MTERETLSYLRTYGRKVEDAESRILKIEESVKYDPRFGLIFKGPIHYSGNLLPVDNYKADIGSVNNFVNNLYLSGKIIYPDALNFGVNNDFVIDRMGKIGFHTNENLDGVSIKGLPSFSIQNATYLGENILFFQINDGTMHDFLSKQDVLLIDNVPYQVIEIMQKKVEIIALDNRKTHMEINATYNMLVYSNLLGVTTAKGEDILKLNGIGDLFYKTVERNAEMNINASAHFAKDVFIKDLSVNTLEINEDKLVPNLNAEFLCGKKGPLNGEIVSTKDNQQLWNKSFGDEIVMHYNRILDLGDPLYDMDAVNKRYVDRYLSGIKISYPVSCCCVESLDADYEQDTMQLHLRSPEDLESNTMISAFDSYELKVNERVLMLKQVNEWQNGVYLVVSDGIESGRVVLQRVSDFCEKKTPEELKAYYVFVRNGRKLGNTGMVFEYNEDFIWNQSAVRFNIFSRTENYSSGNGIKKIGSNFALNTDENIFDFNNGQLTVKERKIKNAMLENNGFNLIPEGGIDLEKCSINLGDNVKLGLRVNRKQFLFGKNGELELANASAEKKEIKLGPDISATGSLQNVYQLQPPENLQIEMQYSEDFFEKERDIAVQYYICSLNRDGKETHYQSSNEIHITDDAKSIFSNLEWKIVDGCDGYVLYRRINTTYQKVTLKQMETSLLDILVPRSFTKVDWVHCEEPPKENATVFIVNNFSTNGANYITSNGLGIGTVNPKAALHLKINEVNSDGVGLQIEGDDRTKDMLRMVRHGMGQNVRIIGENGEGETVMEMGKNFKVNCDEEGVIFLGRDDAPEDKNINDRIGSDNFILQVPDGSIYSGGDIMAGEGKSYSSFNTKLGNNAAILRTGCISNSIGNQVGFIWEGEQLNAVPFNDGNMLTRKKVQVKNFTINHPIYKNKYLVHACLEGETADVYYRGKGVILAGRDSVDISLPDYFCALVEKDSSTFTLTPIGKPFFQLGGEVIECDNKLRVFSDEKYNKNLRFCWEVKGKRIDTDFEVEPNKDEVDIERWGPYTFVK